MDHNAGRENVALQELVKATQDRCKQLEQQIYVRVPMFLTVPHIVVFFRV